MKKNKISKILITIIFCIPLVLIAFFGIKYINEARLSDTITSIRLTLPDQNTIELSGDEFEFYKDIYLDLKALSSAPETPEQYPITSITYVYGSASEKYDLYLSSQPEASYVLNNVLDAFSIPDEHLNILLLDDKFSYIYNDSVLPSLTLKSKNSDTETINTEVLPNSYQWRFEKSDGNLYSSSAKPLYQPTKDRYTIISDSMSSLEFSVAPDIINVVYRSESGATLYESDKLEDIRLTTKDDTNFNIYITAKWLATDDRKTNGTAEYIIQILYDIPESFTISSSNADVGDVIIITAQQLDPAQEVKYTTDLTNASLRFTNHNGTVFTYVPIDNNNVTGTYSLILNVEDRETEFLIHVEGKNYGAAFYNPDNALSDNAESELEGVLAIVNSKNDSIAYFTEERPFKAPVSAEILISYGKEVFYATSPVSVKSNGHIYSTQDGTSVKAAEAGRVIFAGYTERYGNMVVIDHGLGIKTYYCHLKSTTVLENVVIQAGVEVGKSGNSGYTISDMLYFAVSANGVFIDPEIALTEGILLP